MPWNPERYHLFQSERSAPFEDLLKLVHVRPGLQVIDLGCGTGNLTRRLADYLPQSEVIGIDSSAEMLKQAEALESPGLHFEFGRIDEIRGKWDLVFSNAAIQWVPDHHNLVPRLFALVNPGGQLLVQLPSNHNHPSHRIIVETAQEEPFCQALGGWTRRSPVLSIEDYAEILYQQGGQDLVVFEKIYPHVLADADAIADWNSGTVLVPYMERLPSELQDAFMARYRQRLRERWPGSPVFYGFPRTLFSATHP